MKTSFFVQCFIHFKIGLGRLRLTKDVINDDSKIIDIGIINGNCTPFHISNYETPHLTNFLSDEKRK